LDEISFQTGGSGTFPNVEVAGLGLQVGGEFYTDLNRNKGVNLFLGVGVNAPAYEGHFNVGVTKVSHIGYIFWNPITHFPIIFFK